MTTAGSAQAVQRWDYWGRGRPFPVYEAVWSKDDAVCRAIVKALNHPRPGDNKQLYAYDVERAKDELSLYRDPLFLNWTRHPLSEPIGVFPNDNPLRVSAEWMEVPFFNDGRPVIALKITVPGNDRASEHFFVIPDVEYFKSLKLKMDAESMSDSRILWPIEPFLNKLYDELVTVPETMKGYKYWKRSGTIDSQEINVVNIEGRIYVTVRMPNFEQIIVLFFTARGNGHPMCLIGPKKPLKYR